MTYFNKKQPSLSVLAVSIAVIGLGAPLSAWSSDDDDDVQRQLRPESTIEIGIGHVDSGTYKFGDFTGLDNTGIHGIANIEVVKRGGADARWLEIVGRNLGLDSRSLRIEGGVQGDYKLRMEYDAIPKLWTDSYHTPFANPGSSALSLPVGWVPGNTTKLMPGLATGMQSYDISQTRKSLALGVSKLLPAGWEVAFDFKRDKKDGDRLIGGVFGSNGGNPRAAILPEPLDYTTDQFEAIARYVAPKLQLQFGYYGSLFKNDHRSLAWQNPYDNTAWLPLMVNAGYGQPGEWGQLSLPPDNQFHQINASGSYQFSKDTRLSGAFSYGRMTQDEKFLPYTINPTILLSSPLPRNSLDGKINTTHASLKFNTKLAPTLFFNASYRYDDRDNKTPRSLYYMVSGDVSPQPLPGTPSGNIRVNLPFSSTKHHAEANLDWRVAAQTKLKFGYEYDWVKRTYEPIDREREHTAKIGVDHRFNEMASGGITYSYSDRDTDTYDPTKPFREAFPLDWTGTGLGVDNVPTQKRFFIAPRKRDKLRAYANFMPNERLDLQFGVDYKNDDYYKSRHGLREAGGWSTHFDANFTASEAFSTHMFASYEDYSSKQRSSQFVNVVGAITPPTFLDPNRDWKVKVDDRTLTLGLGFRASPSERYEFGGDFSHAYSKGEIKTTVGPLVTTLANPIPDITSRLNRFELFGKYHLQKDLSLNMRYIYERYRSKDFAFDNLLANSANNVIGTGQLSPDYRAHLVGVSLSYRFR